MHVHINYVVIIFVKILCIQHIVFWLGTYFGLNLLIRKGYGILILLKYPLGYKFLHILCWIFCQMLCLILSIFKDPITIWKNWFYIQYWKCFTGRFTKKKKINITPDILPMNMFTTINTATSSQKVRANLFSRYHFFKCLINSIMMVKKMKFQIYQIIANCATLKNKFVSMDWNGLYFEGTNQRNLFKANVL